MRQEDALSLFSAPCSRCKGYAAIRLREPDKVLVECPNCGEFEASWEQFKQGWTDSVTDEPNSP